ncbi:MAG: DUF4139 domain-containing protein [Armatimonadota bacterium]
MKMGVLVALLLVIFVALAATAADLPVNRVVLFSSGVGYFQRGGEIEGDTTVELSFKIDQINDILKSMTVQDLGGGSVGAVTYAPRDPLSHTLQSFAVDVLNNDTLAELLTSLTGEQVTVSIGGETRRGTIVGVESRPTAEGEVVVDVEVLNLLTDAGVTQVPIASVKSITLDDESLSADMHRALAVIADARDKDKKGVSIAFHGDKKREVRVGYLLGTPVWKTSYRLLADDEKSYLQGWAIVENTTDSDWDDVSLSLISGQPISFISDLYQPLYVDRPVIRPQVARQMGPQVYGGAVEEAEDEMAVRREGAGAEGPRGAPPAPAFMKAAPQREDAAEAMDMAFRGGGVQAQAEGAEVGELFQYAIDQPVTIPRQQSAMIPIVNQDIEGTKVSIYNADVNRDHPLNGLRLKNSTELHLMGGPITVFEDNVYAGDAMIEDLPPGDKRLVSYAVDLAVRVDPQSSSRSASRRVAMKIVNGVMHMSQKYHEESAYTIKNTASEPRTIIVEHDIRSGWNLVEPKEADEKAAGVYRFDVVVKAGETVQFAVVEERPISDTVALVQAGVDQIEMLISDVEISDEMKDALQKIKGMQRKIADLQQQITDRKERLEEINSEQERIRQNMAELSHDSDLYQTYVKKLADQEKEFETLQGEINNLEKQLRDARSELRDYVDALSIE